jgi:hypothetical protein
MCSLLEGEKNWVVQTDGLPRPPLSAKPTKGQTCRDICEPVALFVSLCGFWPLGGFEYRLTPRAWENPPKIAWGMGGKSFFLDFSTTIFLYGD